MDENATPPAQTFPGVANPQMGSVQFNAVLISANDVQNVPFTFGLNSMEFGCINDYHNGARTSLNNGTAAQIQNIDAQEGYNQYELTFGNHTYTVIVQVVSRVIQVAAIAGGGNLTWTSPNLFIGGLQINP